MRAGRCQHAEDRCHGCSCWQRWWCCINRHSIHSPVLQAQARALCTCCKAEALIGSNAGSLRYQILASNNMHVRDL